MKKNTKRCRSVVLLFLAKSFSIIAIMILLCQTSFADFQGGEVDKSTVQTPDGPEDIWVVTGPKRLYTQEEIDDKIKAVKDSIPSVYTQEEIDDKIKVVKGSIPNVYTQEEVDDKIKTVEDSIPSVYTQKQVDEKIEDLKDSISALKKVLGDIRNSIPEKMKWTEKTKKVLTDIRNSIPEDIARE